MFVCDVSVSFPVSRSLRRCLHRRCKRYTRVHRPRQWNGRSTSPCHRAVMDFYLGLSQSVVCTIHEQDQVRPTPPIMSVGLGMSVSMLHRSFFTSTTIMLKKASNICRVFSHRHRRRALDTGQIYHNQAQLPRFDSCSTLHSLTRRRCSLPPTSSERMVTDSQPEFNLVLGSTND